MSWSGDFIAVRRLRVQHNVLYSCQPYALAVHLPNIDELQLPSVRDGIDVGSSIHNLRVLQKEYQPESFGRNNLTFVQSREHWSVTEADREPKSRAVYMRKKQPEWHFVALVCVLDKFHLRSAGEIEGVPQSIDFQVFGPRKDGVEQRASLGSFMNETKRKGSSAK